MKFESRGSRVGLAMTATVALCAAGAWPSAALADPPIPGGMTVNP